MHPYLKLENCYKNISIFAYRNIIMIFGGSSYLPLCLQRHDPGNLTQTEALWQPLSWGAEGEGLTSQL